MLSKLLRHWSAQPILILLLCVPALGLAWRALNDTLGVDPAETLEHQTGEWGLRLLLLCLAITPLRRLTGLGALQPFRRTIGLVAFAYLTTHLFSYLGFDKAFEWDEIWSDLTRRTFILLGMSGLLLLIPLAATSTSGMIRRIGARNWRWLHRLIYLATGLGLLHYLLLVKADITPPLIHIAIFAVLMLLRLPLPWRQKNHRTPQKTV